MNFRRRRYTGRHTTVRPTHTHNAYLVLGPAHHCTCGAVQVTEPPHPAEEMRPQMWRNRCRCTTWLRDLEARISQLEEDMTESNTDQSRLDADVAALNDGLTAVEAEIAALKAQPAGTPLDFTALDSAVARAKGDAPAPTPPPAG